MKESTWKSITQLVIPGLFLFGALAYMHGPSYVAFFQKKLLAHSMQRDTLFGPVKYHVRLKADFTAENGDGCEVYVLTDLDPAKNEATNREELLLVNKWAKVVDRKLTTDVGAIRSTHLSPQEGYAMLEVVRNVPDNRRQAEILHFQVTGDQIAMVDSEIRDIQPEWDWHHGPPRRRDSDGDRRRRGWNRDWHPTPEQMEEWKRMRERWEERQREKNKSEVAVAKEPKSTKNVSRDERREQKRAQREAENITRSDNEKDMKRSRPMRADDERLLDVSSLRGTGNEAAELVLIES